MNFWVCLKLGFVRSLGLFEVWVCSKLGFIRSLGLFDSNDTRSEGIEAHEARRDLLVYMYDFSNISYFDYSNVGL